MDVYKRVCNTQECVEARVHPHRFKETNVKPSAAPIALLFYTTHTSILSYLFSMILIRMSIFGYLVH